MKAIYKIIALSIVVLATSSCSSADSSSDKNEERKVRKFKTDQLDYIYKDLNGVQKNTSGRPIDMAKSAVEQEEFDEVNKYMRQYVGSSIYIDLNRVKPIWSAQFTSLLGKKDLKGIKEMINVMGLYKPSYNAVVNVEYDPDYSGWQKHEANEKYNNQAEVFNSFLNSLVNQAVSENNSEVARLVLPLYLDIVEFKTRPNPNSNRSDCSLNLETGVYSNAPRQKAAALIH